MENVINLFNGFVEIENENVSCKIVNEDEFEELVKDYLFEYDSYKNGYNERWFYIDEFDFSNCEVVLNRKDGYRGFGCYEGIVIKNEKCYYIDIIDEGIVSELELVN